jgi:membrane-associated protease RseP (regulator of RpoE activity)
LSSGDRRETVKAVALFGLTVLSVFATYGFFWQGVNPFTHGASAAESGKFAFALMSILLAHEMGHYIVAKRHGFRLSLPYFLPFPTVFGTAGAIIRLRSRPPNRTALLEMGAAGPLAGAAVALIALVLGLPHTTQEVALEPGTYLIFNDPLGVKMLGWLVLGEAPSRYASFHPFALAGWVGCLVTAINLIPIGQLDGGHIVGAAFPRSARRLSIALVGLAVVGGFFWPGWWLWAALIWFLGGRENLPVPHSPPLTRRARWLAGATFVVFCLTFMPVPVEEESIEERTEGSLEPPEASQLDRGVRPE